ncbi:Serine/threonine-protein kinase Kist [Chionoecetes opilio]|uniref:Serine/threonine-protein kinase Kist n=1 Tax=Chionoecetes opilio TaxID=41210 RepID=A0A8J4Y744_CHIOP|nr:Serine/threonine-protein kinase Kist [Chionoecetes opilio]
MVIGMAVSPSSYQFQELPQGLELVAPFGRFRVHTGIAVGRCCEVYEGEGLSGGGGRGCEGVPASPAVPGRSAEGGVLPQGLGHSRAPIVRHFGELQWRGRDILVQELLGPTLKEVLLSQQPRPSSEWLVATLTTHMLRGLQHLHAKGVVHGDLKPPNILWDAESATFKFIDFGVSFTTSEALTHAVQSKGYQAPECVVWESAVAEGSEDSLESAQQPGTAADIWSAGCVVVECLLSRQLFPGGADCDDVPASLRSALTSETSKTYFTRKYLNDSYQFLLRCTQLCPENRATAKDLLEDPWLQQCPRPIFYDLLNFPTRVLRFLYVTEPHPYPPLAEEVEDILVELCAKHGVVEGHCLEASLGNVYVCFRSHRHAESALDHLTDLYFMRQMLTPTFFPLDCWIRREFF